MRMIVQNLRLGEPGVNIIQTDTDYLIINRKLGLKTTGDHAKSWSVHTRNECWLSDRHNYVAFLWSEKIGRIANPSNESAHYSNLLETPKSPT